MREASGRGKDLVALGALVMASIWGTWLFLRSEWNLGSSWTDGAEEYASTSGERIRYAVWDAPRPLEGEVNGLEAESQPAVSPDGHWMVFSVGERGLNMDLFVGELIGGELRDARPLVMLNTGSDELAPAFGPDALYFASDRGGPDFGLDLWRAAYADGVFSPAESIGSGINSISDESDPRPVPGTRQLLFSSNRPRASRTDFDLYIAQPAGAAPDVAIESERAAVTDPRANTADDLDAEAPLRFEVLALEELNTPFDERDPTLTSDGRTLIFASDRDGSLGAFDLYRSFKESGAWLPAKPLLGVNSLRSERGPQLSADGFSLYFDVSGVDQLPDLWRAHSKELFLLPAGALTIYEILGLLALFLLAILAWLSKRWHAIDVIYRCFLISLLIHLFLMWYLREVYPESGPVETAGSERLFRVHLAPSALGTPTTSLERNGQLELSAQAARPEAPARAHSATPQSLAAAAPNELHVARPERERLEPSRREAELAENRMPIELRSAMQDAEAPSERYQGSAPSLAIQSQSTQAARSAVAQATPERSSNDVSNALQQTPAPSSSASIIIARQHESELGDQQPRAERLVQLQAPDAPQGTRVQGPSEAFSAASSTAPEMSMPELSMSAAPERQAGSAERREASSLATSLLAGAALPTHGAWSALNPQRDTSELDSGPRERSLEAPGQRLNSNGFQANMRPLQEAQQDAPLASSSPSFDATLDLSLASAQRRVSADSLPTRRATTPRTQELSAALPTSQGLAIMEAAAPLGAAPTNSRLEPSLQPTPSQQAVAVRDLEESRSPAEIQAPRRFDAMAGLAPSEAKRFERRGPSAPEAPAFEIIRSAPQSEPKALPLVALAAPAKPKLDDLPRRLEHTPYQNRFGEEKLRALDEFGGGVETERAVAEGLDYLASIQNLDGAWGQRSDYDRSKYRDVRVGKSALALLAFLGAGHTQQSDTEHSEVARRCVEYLLGIQDDSNGHFGDSASYGHGIATYALAECYALTQDPRLRPAVERGIQRILGQQDRRRDPRLFGGWGYYFRDDSIWNNDTWPRVSVTSWQVMALKSARIGGLGVPDAALQDAETFLGNSWDPRRKAFRYSHEPARLNSGYPILPASTPAALFALSLLGTDISSSELAPARRFVLERAPMDYNYSGADDFVYRARGNLYFWYYSTLAMFRVGGSEWARWNASMKDTLLASQSDNGSWRPLSTYSEFAGDDDHERTYSTAMCVLTLEVYYRYFTPLLDR